MLFVFLPDQCEIASSTPATRQYHPLRFVLPCLSTSQGGVTPVASVLPSATAVKIKVNGQLEIFFIVNSQATISL